MVTDGWKKAKYFAVSYPSAPKRVGILVRNCGEDDEGRIEGHIINGNWGGSFTEATTYVHQTESTINTVIVWSGDWPGGTDYNEAIEKIEELINGA